MAKITISDILGMFSSVSNINSRFQQVVDEFNDKVLYRDNPGSEPNQMENDIDLNNNDLLNVNKIDAKVLEVDGESVTPFDPTANYTVTGAWQVDGQWDFSVPPTGVLNPSDNQTISGDWDFTGALTQDGSDVVTQADSVNWTRTLVAGSPNVTVVDDGAGNYTVDAAALGGGDVFQAGNNTFTGDNEFQGELTKNGIPVGSPLISYRDTDFVTQDVASSTLHSLLLPNIGTYLIKGSLLLGAFRTDGGTWRIQGETDKNVTFKYVLVNNQKKLEQTGYAVPQDQLDDQLSFFAGTPTTPIGTSPGAFITSTSFTASSVIITAGDGETSIYDIYLLVDTASVDTTFSITSLIEGAGSFIGSWTTSPAGASYLTAEQVA